MTGNTARAPGNSDSILEARSSALCDELRKRGVNCKGYGVIAKYVMLDPDITIEAKGIYAYFCSYSGSESTAFPCRDKIVSDLKVNKDTYYKHFRFLTEDGYILATQKSDGGYGQGFCKNIYEINDNPKKFQAEPEDPTRKAAYSLIRTGGLHDAGFGFIPKAVMQDPSISLKAKALYAYYRSFCGAGVTAYPKKRDILYHLGISHNLYSRLITELLDAGYININQRRVDGRLNVNDICIPQTPIAAPKKGKKKYVAEEISAQISDTQISDTQISDTQIQDTQISDTKKNNIKNNNSSNYQSSHQQPAYDAYAHEDGWMDSEEPLSLDDIQDALDAEGTIPESWVGNREVVYPAVRMITSYEERVANGSLNAGTGGDYTLFMEALTDMLCAARPMTLAGERVSAYDVRDHLERFLRKSDFYFGDGTLYLNEVDEVAIEAYAAACESKPIKNPLGYMKACIWTALKTGDAATRASVSYDAKNRS